MKKSAVQSTSPSLAGEVRAVVASLKEMATPRTRDSMARYGIPADRALGVTVSDLHGVAKKLGRNHDLALALWDTGIYEARLLAAFIGEPARVTPVQMDRWCRDFDSWAVCDTACFHLFDRSPHAWKKVKAWASRREEFQKRAAFALLASLAAHDKAATDDQFVPFLPLIAQQACDERNFVKKGVSWALRMIGRRSTSLYNQALELGKRLSQSEEPACRWVGKDAVRDLANPKVSERVARRSANARSSKRGASSPQPSSRED